MNTQEIFQQFSHAQFWNAFSYTAYKILFYTVTITLFKTLPAEQFAQWATVNSVAFLILLWLDCGLRKSVPLFAPTFANNQTINKLFICYLLFFKITLLAVATPLFYWYLCNYITHSHYLITAACSLFIIEGIVGLLRLIFHAYFWNKQFNLLSTFITTIMMLTTIGWVIHMPQQNNLIAQIIGIRAASNCILIGISLIMLKYLTSNTQKYTEKDINLKSMAYQFATHSGAMWITTFLKSLSERNFLVPLFTHILGPVAGGLFKVANDGALLFYRIILKTIGTTDTSLLAHVHAKQKDEMNYAFKKLTTRIAALCLPLLGIIGVLSFNDSTLIGTNMIFNLFLIMAVGYLLETLLLSYERLLEVSRAYVYIGIAYVPYICFIIALASGYLTTLIGFYASVACIHGVRLVSLLIMALFARTYYKVIFPLGFVLALAGGCAALILVTRLAAYTFKISIPLISFLPAG